MVLPAAGDDGGTPPLKYRIEGLPAGVGFNPESRTLSGAPTTSHRVTSCTYTVSDSDDYMDRWDEAWIEFDMSIAPAKAPTTRAGYHAVTLNWNKPTDTGIAGWLLSYGRAGSGVGINWIRIQPTGTQNLSYTVNGLTGGATYEFQIRAVTGSGLAAIVGAPSNSVTATPLTPAVTLVLTSASITEDGGVSTVTASLSGASSAATTVTVSATAVSPAVAGDFTLSQDVELSIAAGKTTSTGTVTTG